MLDQIVQSSLDQVADMRLQGAHGAAQRHCMRDHVVGFPPCTEVDTTPDASGSMLRDDDALQRLMIWAATSTVSTPSYAARRVAALALDLDLEIVGRRHHAGRAGRRNRPFGRPGMLCMP